MARIQIFDKPLCCSTGVCGPQVDPILPQFASDLDWLKKQGHQVERFNLAQQPDSFVTNSSVQQILTSTGVESLPVVIVDGEVVSSGAYPSRNRLAAWTNTSLSTIPIPLSQTNSCCGNDGCC